MVSLEVNHINVWLDVPSKRLFSKRVFERAKHWYYADVSAWMMDMSDKTDEHMIEELNQAIKKRNPKEPIEKTLVTFCAKTGISMESCRIYYKQIEQKGKASEKNSLKL
jgi:hypothetical protein